MSNKINFGDLFDFGSDAELKKGIEAIDELLNKFTTLLKEATDGSDNLANSTKQLTQNIAEQQKVLQKANITTKEGQETIMQSAAIVEKSIAAKKENEAVEQKQSQTVKQLTDNIKALTEQKKQLEAQTKKGTDANKAAAGSIDELKNKVAQAKKKYEELGQDIDPFIKSKALQNYAAYKKQLEEANAAVKAAANTNAAAKGSYNALNEEVKKLQKELKNLPDTFGKNKEKAAQLQKVLFDKTQTLKDFDAAINVHNRNVGNYQSALGGANNILSAFGVNLTGATGGLQNAFQGVQQLSGGMKGLRLAIASTGIGLLVLALASLVTYLMKTDDGSELLQRKLAGLGAVVDVLIGLVAKLGEWLIAAFENPQEALADLIDFFEPLYDIVAGFLTMDTEQMQRGLNKVGEEAGELGKEMARAFEEAEKLEAQLQKLEDKQRDFRLENAKTRQEIDLLYKSSKDRTLSEAQRLANLEKAGEKEIDLMNKSLALAQENLNIIKAQNKEKQRQGLLTDDMKDKQVDAEIELINLQSESLNKLQDIQNKKSIFLAEEQREKEAAFKKEKERLEKLASANDQLNKFRLEQSIKINEEIGKSEKVSQEERIAAYMTAAQDRIKIAEIEKNAALRKEGLLAQERTLILEQFEAKVKEINKNLSVEVDFKIPLTFQQLLDLEAQKAEELKNLEAMNNAERLARLKAYMQELINATELSEQEKFNKYQEFAKKIEDLNAKATQKEKEEQDKRLANDKAYLAQKKAAYQQLGQELFAATVNLVHTLNEAEEMQRQERLTKLDQDRQNELALAGNNAALKAQIDRKYAAEQKKIREESAKAKRKEAIFDKFVAATQIGINTAMGISKAIAQFPLTGGMPFAAIVAAIGAVQLAAVLAKPIPNFFKGTESSPEGLAWVGEKGTELMEKNGKYSLTPNKPTLTWLDRGTKIYTADKTRDILESENMRQNLVDSYVDSHGRLVMAQQPGITPEELEQRIAANMGNHLNGIKEAIENKAEFYLNVTKEGIGFLQKKGDVVTEYLNEKYYNRS